MLLRLVSCAGLVILTGSAWLLSERRRHICWRTVGMGIGLQVLLGLLVLRTAGGRVIFAAVRAAFVVVIDSSRAGAEFVFGSLVPERGFIFFITVPCTLIFFSALMALLYHWGVMQRVVHAMAWIMHRTMRITGRESLAAAANVFVGMTEAPLFIRPYLSSLTRSELMALLVTGLATIAGTVMAVYISMGIDAGHLMTASIMSAPAALVVAKMLVPHDPDLPDEDFTIKEVELHEHAVNSFEAITNGARDGLYLALNVCAMLIAVLSLLALVNAGLGIAGGWIGIQNLTLQRIFGFAGYPIAVLMGVPLADAATVGELLSTKVFLTELVAYVSLAEQMHEMSPRAVTIATYALCGFANFGSIAILLGGLSALAPDRKADVARLALKALLGGVLASFMTACVAGILA